MRRHSSGIEIVGHEATPLWEEEATDSDDVLDEIEVVGQITGLRGAVSLVGNVAGRRGETRQENQQTKYGSMTVGRGLYGGLTEEEDKTGSESRGQMGKGYANGTASGPRRAQRNRGTVTPPSPPSASPVRRSYASSSPSISPPFAERTPDHPSRLAEKVNASPTEAPNPSYTLVPHAPRAPAPHQGQSTPPSYTAAYNYYSSYYMSYNNMFGGPHLPPRAPMYGYGYPYPPPMGYPARGYDDAYDPVRGYAPPHPSMAAYGMYPYYPRPLTGGSDGMYRSPNSVSPPRAHRELSSHGRQKTGEHVPRPKNAFIFYRSWLIKSQAIPHSLEPDHRNLSRIAGEMWRKLGNKDREKYVEMARLEKEEHKKKYPNYRYSPAQRVVHHAIAPDGNRRRVQRRPEADLEEKRRCAEISNLVAAGITGDQLEAAMKEKGHFVPTTTIGMKRKRNRQRDPESEDDEASPPPQPAPAYRSAVPSVMHGPEPEVKSVSSDADGQIAPSPDQQYWAQSQQYSAGAAAAQPFYAGHDDPSAFILPRPDAATTAMEPFALLAQQAPSVVDGNADASSTTHSALRNNQDKPKLVVDGATRMTVAPQTESNPPSVMVSPISANHPQHIMVNGDNNMSYYRRGMHSMVGFVASA